MLRDVLKRVDRALDELAALRRELAENRAMLQELLRRRRRRVPPPRAPADELPEDVRSAIYAKMTR